MKTSIITIASIGILSIVGCGGGGGGVSSALVGKTYYINESNENYSEFTYNTGSITEIEYDIRGQFLDGNTLNVAYVGTDSFKFTTDGGSQVQCTMMNSQPKHLTCSAEGESGSVDIEQLTMTELISEKVFVSIMKDVPTDICESALFRDEIADAFINVVTSEEDNTATCAKYGKTEGDDCNSFYYEGAGTENVSCVIGFNVFNAEARTKSMMNNTKIESIINNKMKRISK